MTWGIRASKLPSPELTLELLKSQKIHKVRIHEPFKHLLTAIKDGDKGWGFDVVVGIPNYELKKLATDFSFATKYVKDHILSYFPSVRITCITVGEEAITGADGDYVLLAMQNIKNSMNAEKVDIPVSTVVGYNVIKEGPSPSEATFSEPAAKSRMPLIVSFLKDNQYPLFASLYPESSYTPGKIHIDSALGKPSAPVVCDADPRYNSVLEVMTDSVYYALRKHGGENIRVVTETGWPNADAPFASKENAKEYITNVIRKSNGPGTLVGQTTYPVEAYIYSLFDEDQNNFVSRTKYGIYNSDMSPIFQTPPFDS